MKYLKICLLALVVLSACSKYERILKSEDFGYKYRKAVDYYTEEDYLKASALFDNISTFYRATNKIDTINYFNAMCQYKIGDFMMAAHFFNQFADYYPNSQFLEDAEYMNAYCFYKSSPKPSLDQTYTIKAIELFQLFIRKFPSSKYVPEAKTNVVELHNKLIDKSFMNAKLYFDIEQYKASIIALNNSLSDYPDSKYRENILFLLVKSNFLLASNSVKAKKNERFQSAIDAYYSFIDEFPSSQYVNEVKKIYELSKNELLQSNN